MHPKTVYPVIRTQRRAKTRLGVEGKGKQKAHRYCGGGSSTAYALEGRRTALKTTVRASFMAERDSDSKEHAIRGHILREFTRITGAGYTDINSNYKPPRFCAPKSCGKSV
jgi:hypothetical protein